MEFWQEEHLDTDNLALCWLIRVYMDIMPLQKEMRCIDAFTNSWIHELENQGCECQGFRSIVRCHCLQNHYKTVSAS